MLFEEIRHGQQWDAVQCKAPRQDPRLREKSEVILFYSQEWHLACVRGHAMKLELTSTARSGILVRVRGYAADLELYILEPGVAPCM